MVVGFLSYLCGSEPTVIGSEGSISFLSYLCGSELNSKLIISHYAFLSYLCGSERLVPAFDIHV